jgi:hypothetical protein
MKTIITSPKGPPLGRVLCSFLFGAAAFSVVPANTQAAGPTPTPTPNIVWVTTGNTIAAYNANGTALNGFNLITEQSLPAGGILVSGQYLHVPSDWWDCCPNSAYLYALLHDEAYLIVTTYNAATGTVVGTSWFGAGRAPLFVPGGIAGSTGLFYVANQRGSIAQGGNFDFINSSVASPYALAVNGLLNVLYVTNNAQNSNGDFYISTYTANTGVLINANFIEIATGGLYGLALQGNTLYVSVFSGSAPGVYPYNATTGAALPNKPFFPVNEPWGIAIEGNRLFVASHLDSKIYEFNATTGAKLRDSIKVSAPTYITVEPATALGN